MNEQMPDAVHDGAEKAEEILDGGDLDAHGPEKLPDEAPRDVAERPGDTSVDKEHADEVADEWGKESFPGSDPPAHY